MRPIKELLMLVRDELPGRIERGRCICWTIAEMYDELLTEYEVKFLVHYIEQRRPGNAEGYAFYWPGGELAPRMKYLDELINEL